MEPFEVGNVSQRTVSIFYAIEDAIDELAVGTGWPADILLNAFSPIYGSE